jgi:hypothetical protein
MLNSLPTQKKNQSSDDVLFTDRRGKKSALQIILLYKTKNTFAGIQLIQSKKFQHPKKEKKNSTHRDVGALRLLTHHINIKGRKERGNKKACQKQMMQQSCTQTKSFRFCVVVKLLFKLTSAACLSHNEVVYISILFSSGHEESQVRESFCSKDFASSLIFLILFYFLRESYRYQRSSRLGKRLR